MEDADLSLDHAVPAVEPATARVVAAETFGLEAVDAVEELPGERDRNFRLRRVDGARETLRVLKFTELGTPPELLDLQEEALTRLRRADARYRFPRPRPSTEGELAPHVEDERGRATRVRLLDWVPGRPLAESRPHTPELLEDVGRLVGTLDRRLEGLEGEAADRPFLWDLRRGRKLVDEHLDAVEEAEVRERIRACLELYDATIPALESGLRIGLIHGDPNDHNLLVEPPRPPTSEDSAPDPRGRRIAGLVDFGDMVRSWTVGDPAIAAAYAMLGKRDPLHAAAAVVRGAHAARPLDEAEIDALYPLALLRLCTTVTFAARQRRRRPERPYLTVSDSPARQTLRRLGDVSPHLARYLFRHACGLPPCPSGRALTGWLRARDGGSPPVLGGEAGDALEAGRHVVFDLRPGSLEAAEVRDDADAGAWERVLFGRMREADVPVGVGRYDEVRRWYRSDLFRVETDAGPAWRTVHVGLDLFAEPGTPVRAPLAGRVHAVARNDGPGDYGPTLVLEHEVDLPRPPDRGEEDTRPGPGSDGADRGSSAGPTAGERLRFYTLYGHLAPDVLEAWEPGDPVGADEGIGAIGAAPANGGWAPHLHLQVIAGPLGARRDVPGVARPDERSVWTSVCPDPGLLPGVPGLAEPPEPTPAGSVDAGQLLDRRRRLLAPNLSLHYRRPLHIVRGWMQHLYDADGQPYLDGVNNVAHVGHSHPRVVEAMARQSAVLNTNTRYLHEHLVRYAERLVATLPKPLEVCSLVCTGSEANELALRMARAHTGAEGVVVVEGAYHGNTGSMVQISPYKYRGPGGEGRPEHVRELPMPDPYRGRYRGRGRETGRRYAEHVDGAAESLASAGPGVAAFFCESLLGCGGQIVLPDGYLEEAFRRIRAAGGVCVADEVQVGFGRVGDAFWGFETQGVVPDVVTMGKPIGNGHPLAAVVTTREIAASFANGMEYFNTFGGNPVSCLAGLAVLDVVEEEGLREHAREVGGRLLENLESVAGEHPGVVGDVRGLGLFAGVELVRDRTSRDPAPGLASYLVERLRDLGILLSTDGPDHNVLKIKPPLPFDRRDADRLAEALDRALGEDVPASVGAAEGT